MVDPAEWRQHCVVAYLDEPPYFVPVSGSDPTGCDIELATMVLGALGVAEIEFVLTTFAELIDGLRSHRWHVNVPMFITEQRSHLVKFSRPVWAAIDSFIVRLGDDRDFSSYEVIALDDSVRIAAVTGQVQIDTAVGAGVPQHRLIRFADQLAAAEAVLRGEADAAVSTAPGNAALVARLGNPTLRCVVDSMSDQRDGAATGAFSFNHESHELADAFDAQLRLTLGTAGHLEMMARYGFHESALRPVIDS
jgi:polar amino acid transport system substrate-binding protein